jgi:hypothetical protein
MSAQWISYPFGAIRGRLVLTTSQHVAELGAIMKLVRVEGCADPDGATVNLGERLRGRRL